SLRRRHRRGPPARRLRCATHEPARPPVLPAAGRALRNDHDVRRPGPGRRRRLGEPPSRTGADIMTERVTRVLARDVPLDGLGTLALLTLDNGEGPTKPNTFGPLGIAELTAALERVRERAHAGEIAAVAITGKPFHFAAGADLREAAALTGSRADA